MLHIVFRKILLLTLFCAGCSGVVSCRLVDRFFSGDVVARVGSSVLNRSDIAELLSPGCPPEDSAAIVERYIMSWATDKLLLQQAEKELPNSEQDITREVEELRSDLLVYRFEKMYADAHLDTLISDEECQHYYQEHPNSFITDSYLVTGRFVKVATSSPNCQIIRSIYMKENQEEELNRLCGSSAEKFISSDDKWRPVEMVAADLGMSVDDCVSALEKNRNVSVEEGEYTYLLYFTGKIHPGEVAPYSFSYSKIKEVILSRRKQELILNLEKNLLTDARSSGDFFVYQQEQ